MNDRTEGAWIMHHTNKLNDTDSSDFEDIDFAGKAGKLLSGLCASNEESLLSKEKVGAIAKGVGISKIELPTLLNKLQAEQLIDQSSSGEVASIGVTTSSVLGHTATIFRGTSPTLIEKASLMLAEKTSAAPVEETLMNEYLSDFFKIPKSEASEIIQVSQEIGFIDYEIVDEKGVLFNGNLFKSDNIKKATKVLESLASKDVRALINIDDEIAKNGCIPFEKAVAIATENLLEKVQSIGMYDFNKVSNATETKIFITKPESFSKYGSPFEEDALDLAKSLVASLAYGMIYSSSKRGRISFLKYLLNALIRGDTVGPAPAIGQDYKYLEIKRVVEIIPAGGKYFSMRLLKREVGELALQVMQKGDTVETNLLTVTTDVSAYEGPEKNRVTTRKKRQVKQSDKELADLLRTLRQK